MKVAILTRPDYKSPRVLSESLKIQIEKAGAQADIFFFVDALSRLQNYNDVKHLVKIHFWLRRKLVNFLSDRRFLKSLKNYDAVVISECSPNGFWRHLYQVEKLKAIIRKPVLYYEVYFLGNAPSQIAKLQEAGHPLLERYDWHLAVADVTEIKTAPNAPWSCIGLDLTNTGLGPTFKKDFTALIDFEQRGFEEYRQVQLEVLKDLGVNTIVLNGSYSSDEIRELYKKASVFFMQSYEAFGLPIAECFACGVQVFTPLTAWPMSWRLDEKPGIHAEGKLPEIFTSYSSSEDLKNKLTGFMNKYDEQITPVHIFNKFIECYPHYYHGNVAELRNVLKRIRTGHFS